MTEAIVFLTIDPTGFSGFSKAQFTVKGTDQLPIAAFANVAEAVPNAVGAITTTSIRDGLFELYGTADDPDAIDEVSYRLSLYDPNGSFVTRLTPQPVNASGYHVGRVAAGELLGELDLTRVRNGVYDLYLDVKSAGRSVSKRSRIALNSESLPP